MQVLPPNVHPVPGQFADRLFIKRLDAVHSEVSGNKWYKLKYNVDALNKTAHRTMLTFGGPYSNHIAATAAAGRLFGFHTIGIIRGEEPKQWSHTLQKAASDGMRLEFIERSAYELKQTEDMKAWLLEQFGAFHLVPEGGSNFLGINGCMEILDEADAQYDVVVVAVGTGATLAGMLLSAAPHQQFIGVPVMKQGELFRDEIIRHLEYFLMDREAALEYNERFTLATDYHFGGYAKWTPELIDWMETFESETSIPLEQVYTAKTMFATYDLLKKGFIAADKKVLFIHTGGLQGKRG